MKAGKKVLSVVICLIMAFGTVAVGGDGLLKFFDAMSFKASAADNYSVGDIIEFGSYPQSDVIDESLIAELNGLVPLDKSLWDSYNYYGSNHLNRDFMKYKDVSYNGEKYRAVYFDEYRPFAFEDETEEIQAVNNYYVNTVYWFKYEPLRWIILDPEEHLIMCESIIDSQPYSCIKIWNDLDKDTHLDDDEYFNETGAYASDWKTSSIRNWLNNDFYYTAFIADEQENIKEKTNNNLSVLSILGFDGVEKYDGESTIDKVFLLSLEDAINDSYGFEAKSEITLNGTSNEIYPSRQAMGSSYSKCQGLGRFDDDFENYCPWIIRSCVCSDGIVVVGESGDMDAEVQGVDDTVWGIRPVITVEELNLTSGSVHNHSYIGTVAKEASCQEEGIKTFICSCGDSYTETLSKADHMPKIVTIPATCTQNGTEYTICTVCGKPLSEATVIHSKGHKYNSGVVIKPATTESTGIKSYKCTVCGYEKTETISKIVISDLPKSSIIKGNSADNKVLYDYKSTVTFTANVPAGGSVQWYVDGKKAGNKNSLNVKDSTSSYKVTVVVTDKDGNQTMDEENVTIKNDFFSKLIWFFKHLFNPGAYNIKQ